MNLFYSIILTGGGKLNVWKLLLDASGMVMGVLILLLLFSVASWYIIGFKFFFLRRAARESEKFLEVFWNSKRLDAIYKSAQELKRSPIAAVFRTGYIELSKIKGGEENQSNSEWMSDMQSIERALERAHTSEQMKLENMIPFLATTGSAAPFVGLFGTVWGIMNSFLNMDAEQSASLLTVAPGIAEALIATAIGLMAAIPAVVAYNYFRRRVAVQVAEMDTFSNDFLNIVKRHFFS